MNPMVKKFEAAFDECLTVSCLYEIMQSLMDDGYGDAVVAFQLGEVNSDSKALFNLPIADVCAAQDKSTIFLTPWGRPEDEESFKPKLSITITDDAISLSVNDNDAQTEGEAEHV